MTPISVLKTGGCKPTWVRIPPPPLLFRPGKPVDNAYIEAFNGRLRDECLNQYWFLNLADARRIIERWRISYNTDRPHRALNRLTPQQYAEELEQQNLNRLSA